MTLTIRPGTTADIERQYGQRPPLSVRALVAEKDGKVIGIGGLAYHGGRLVGFGEFTDALRGHRFALFKAARRLLKQAKGPVYAEADPEVPKSREFLERLGFTHLSGDLYLWRR